MAAPVGAAGVGRAPTPGVIGAAVPSTRVVQPAPPAPGQISPIALKLIGALEDEKKHRTPAQLKMDSQLVYADQMRRGAPIADGVPTQRVRLDQDAQGRVLVDITARVSPTLLAHIESAGGDVINNYPQYDAIRARVPLATLEPLAARADVRFVAPAAQAHVRGWTQGVDRQGDAAHQAGLARATFGIDGSGVTIGVMSDAVQNLSDAQAAGQLPFVNVLSGQSGSGPSASGEGTAMLEIVQTLAPGAQLLFATAFGGKAAFASNIVALAQAGCSIIVDDVGYDGEFPFQDDILAQAVNTVTTGGTLYFSAASNSGNANAGTSQTWEGDFSDGGQTIPGTEPGRVHSFNGTNYNLIINGAELMSLFWADPIGASTNDYDLFILDATGTNIESSSTNPQNGTQDPYESAPPAGQPGEMAVVVKVSGAARFLHLDNEFGSSQLAISTGGQIRGHQCATNAFAVAAVDVAQVGYTNSFASGTNLTVEKFSSDGPRRVFFQPDGTPLTPGNFTSTGGVVRLKPDLAAADNVATSVPGFLPFPGTSAAAPHAAAIAALLLGYQPLLTQDQIRKALTGTTLDIESPGWDRDSGYGIVMPLPALRSLGPPPPPSLSLLSVGDASPGGQLFLYGTNLGAVTNVTIGGVPAPFTIQSNGLIIATIPAGGTNGNVSVATAVASASAPFAVTPPPTPLNDLFTNAALLKGAATFATTNTTAAAKEPGEPNHAGNTGGKSVWYSWTAPAGGNWTLDSSGSDFPTLMAVYAGADLTQLSVVASNALPGGGFTSTLTFAAVQAATYHIALDGVNGAGGNAALFLAPAFTAVSNQTVYATAFEAAQGFQATLPLAGQMGWLTDSNGPSGILTGYFPGQGQQAYVGLTHPTNGIVPPVSAVGPRLNFTPDLTLRPVVQFSVLMAIVSNPASTNTVGDSFNWDVFNINGDKLFSLQFGTDGSARYTTDDGNSGSANLMFNGSGRLTVTMDFGLNTWSASVGTLPIAAGQPITGLGSELNLGSIRASWVPTDNANPGTDAMVFDNYTVTAFPRVLPTILARPQTPTGQQPGQSAVLGVVASGLLPLSYQWYSDQVLIPGATNATLLVNGLAPLASHLYQVTVSDSVGSTTAGTTVFSPYALLAQPQAQLGSPAWSASAGAVLNLTLTPGLTYGIQTSADLGQWSLIYDYFANGSNTVFFDPTATNSGARFYRVTSP
ncbi:MAG: S8 family serine peptidase [Verrucomicrobia bacterium]|nr:S8 family serine peptidase [Verrucomicrobiota bacterium]